MVGKEYDIHLRKDLFEKIGGKISEEGKAYALFEGFTEDGKIIKFIRKIGKPDDYGRLQFGGKAIYEKVGTNEIYVRVIKMIESSEDFYQMFKENIGEINIKDIKGTKNTIVKLASHEKLMITNVNGKIKEIDLKEVELHWNNAEGALGIRGKIVSGYGEITIGIYYDGGLHEGTYMEIVAYDGRKLHGIEMDENDVLKLLYIHEREEIHRIFFGEVPSVKLKVSGDRIEYCLVNEKSWNDWFGAGKNNIIKGNIAELWAKEILKILFGDEYKVTETAGGTKNSEIADLNILEVEDGKFIPGSVKSFKYKRSEKRIESIKGLFDEKLNEIIEELKSENSDFKKQKYTESEYALAIIIGLSEDEGCCDVLIAKVFNNEKLTTKIIYKPTWWWE